MPQPKNAVIAGLALIAAGLSVLAYVQSRELAQLKSRKTVEISYPILTYRRATERQVSLPAVPLSVMPREDHSNGSYGPDLGFSPKKTAIAPRRPRTIGQLLENPEFVGALSLYQQSALDAKFAALFRKLDLSAGELAAFKKLLAQKESAEFDVVAIGETISENPLSPQELQGTVRMVREGVEREIASALGSDRYAIYRDYAQTLPQRTTVAQLEQRLSYSRTPLTADQSEQMVRVLAANTPATADAVVTAPTAMVGGDELSDTVPLVRRSLFAAVVTDDALASAQTVLSPEQLTALAQIQNEQLSALHATQLIRSANPGLAEPPIDWKALLQ